MSSILFWAMIIIPYALIIGLIALIIYFVYKHLKKK